ncbi:MAG: hypothetical protein QOJ41_644 [Acidobacteriaceae bacterium]|jgi:hypothetical protein|nr:hypothetical protein [Acidobacteriaceae bacterium]
MHRAPHVFLTVSLATVFFGGRYALGQGEPQKTDVGSVYSMVGENSLASLPPIIPVAGADLEELAGKARVCLSMLNTLVRRFKKRPLTGAAAPSAVRNIAHISSLKFETRS